MENRTIQELFSRKSVRVFSDEKITEEEKRLILEAAIQAPTAGNMSLFSILDIQSQEIKDVLAKSVLDKAVEAYKNTHKDAEIKEVELYIVAEEGAAYYVVNGEASDDFKVIL